MRLKLVVSLSVLCITLLIFSCATHNSKDDSTSLSEDTPTHLSQKTLDVLHSKSAIAFYDSGLHYYGVCLQVPLDADSFVYGSPCILTLTDSKISFHLYKKYENGDIEIYLHDKADITSIDTLFYQNPETQIKHQLEFKFRNETGMVINLTDDDFQTPNIEGRDKILSLMRERYVVLAETEEIYLLSFYLWNIAKDISWDGPTGATYNDGAEIVGGAAYVGGSILVQLLSGGGQCFIETAKQSVE